MVTLRKFPNFFYMAPRYNTEVTLAVPSLVIIGTTSSSTSQGRIYAFTNLNMNFVITFSTHKLLFIHFTLTLTDTDTIGCQLSPELSSTNSRLAARGGGGSKE